MRPRPDHVSPVFGSRYFAFTSEACATSGTLPIGLVASSRATCPTLRTSAFEIASSISRFKYAMLFSKIATSSHPSSPASLSTSTSAVLGDNWLSAIFRYSHSRTPHLPGLQVCSAPLPQISGKQTLLIVGQDLDANDLACPSAASRSSICVRRKLDRILTLLHRPAP